MFLLARAFIVGAMLLSFASVSKVAHSQQDPNLIALFGDSISFGYNAAFPSPENGLGRLDRGVPSIFLNQILIDNRRVSLVSNLGVGGSASGPSGNPFLTSNHGVGRINSDLAFIRNAYAPTREQYALIIYGTNDHGYSISSTTTGFNIALMIDGAIAQGFIPIIGTIPPCVCKDVIPVNNAIRQAVLTKQAQGREVYLVDHYNNLLPNWPSLVDPDGIHPNNNGYLTMANFWFDNRLNTLIPRDRLNSISGPLFLLLGDD